MAIHILPKERKIIIILRQRLCLAADQIQTQHLRLNVTWRVATLNVKRQANILKWFRLMQILHIKLPLVQVKLFPFLEIIE